MRVRPPGQPRRVLPMPVRESELELDAFERPFDLLLTLLLKEELEPREIDIAAIVIAFVERAAERDALDLEACGEFLVLVSALLELKARAPFSTRRRSSASWSRRRPPRSSPGVSPSTGG